MDEKEFGNQSAEVLLYLKSIDEKLSRRDKSRGRWLAEVLLVPGAIALLSTLIAVTQIVGAREQARTAKFLGYLNIFYNEIRDSSQPERQIYALQILHQIDPDVGMLLAEAVQSNPENTREVRFAAGRVDAALTATMLREKLRDFRTVIYYPNWLPNRKGEAIEIYENLKAFKLNAVEIKGKEQSFFGPILKPRGYEIRHDGTETDQAKALKDLVEFILPGKSFRLVQSAQGKSPGAVTVFVPIE
jgi:hypothetical protein